MFSKFYGVSEDRANVGLNEVTLMSDVSKLEKRISVLSGIINSSEPQAGWDLLGTHHLANSIESISAEAQRLNIIVSDKAVDMTNLMSNLNDTFTCIMSRLLPSVENALKGVDKVANEGVNVNLFDFSFLKNLLDNPLKRTLGLSMLYLVVEILSQKYDIPHIGYIKVMLGTMAIFQVTGKLKDMFVDWITQRFVVTLQSDWTDWLSVAAQGVIFASFGTTLDFSTLSKAVASLAGAAQSATKLQEIFNLIINWFKEVACLVAEATGFELYEWLKPSDKKIRSFIDRVNELNAMFLANPMAVDVEFVNRTSRLLIEVNDYQKTIALTSKNQPVLVAMKNLVDKLTTLQVIIGDAGMAIGDRYEPMMDVLAGPPGVGKTFLTEMKLQRLMVAMAETIEEVVELERNWKNAVYTWPMDNKHHDQYKGQRIIMYPDLFCQTDAEGMPSEASSIVYIIGDQPMPLTAAEISKKHKLFAINDVVVANTNVVRIYPGMFKSIRNPGAVIRRCNENSFYCYVNERYRKRDALGNLEVDPLVNVIKGYEHDRGLYCMIDPETFDNENPPNDLWTFRRIDFATGTFVDDKLYDFDGYMDIVIAKAKAKRIKGAQKKENLKREMAGLVERRLEQLRNPVPQAHNVAVRIDPDFKKVVVEQPVIEDPLVVAKRRMEMENHKAFIAERTAQKMGYLSEAQKMAQALEELEEEFQDAEELSEEDKALLEELEGLADELIEEENEPALVSDSDDDMPMPELEHDIPQMDDRVDLGDGVFVPREFPEMNREWLRGNIHISYPPLVQGSIDKQIRSERPSLLTLNKWKIFDTHMTVTQYVTISGYLDRMAREMLDIQMPMHEARAMLRQGLDVHVPMHRSYLTIIRQIVNQMDNDPDCRDITCMMSVSDLLEVAMYDLEAVNHNIVKNKMKYYFGTPIVEAFNDVANYLVSFRNSMWAVVHPFLRPAINVAWNVYEFIAEFVFTPEFQFAFKIVMIYILSLTGSIMFITLAELFMRWALGTDKKQKRPLARHQGDDEEREDASPVLQSTMNVAEGINNTLEAYADNFACLYVVVHSGGKTYTRHPCNVSFLSGQVGVIVDHARLLIEQLRSNLKTGEWIELVLVPFYGKSLEKSVERTRLDAVLLETSPELSHNDLAIIIFKNMRNRPNIMKLVPNFESLKYLYDLPNVEGIFLERTTGTNLEVKGPPNKVGVRFNFGNESNYPVTIDVEGKATTLGVYHYKNVVMRSMNGVFTTKAGYCTSPGFVTDERKNHCVKLGWPQAQQIWFMYLHTSLGSNIPNGTYIFKEMFEPWMDLIMRTKIQPVIEAVNENIDFMSATVGEVLKKVPQMDKHVVYERIPLDANHDTVGSIEHTFFEPRKSEIVRTALYDCAETTRYPSVFGVKKTPEGDLVDVKEVAREPCGANNACLNENLVNGIMHQVKDRVFSDSSPPVDDKVLEFSQCVYGDTAYNLPSTNWQSSSGTYLRLMKDFFKTDWKGKSWMLGKDDKLLPDVEALVVRIFDHYDAKIRNGERMYSLVADNIKDELLAKEKVKYGKSRLFCVYDFVYLLLSKKYYGSMAGWIYDNRISNGFAVGVNPYSEDWGGIAQTILNNSTKCIFIDHSKFDKNQLRQIMKIVTVVARSFYVHGNEGDHLAREMLLEEIINSLHVTMHKGRLYIYFWEQGNTSGNFLTTILNCLVNMVYMYICCLYAWMIHFGWNPDNFTAVPANPIDKAFRMVCLGDDITASINDELMPGVNFNTIQKVGKTYLNITITDELKTGGDTPDFRELTDGSFLGRTFEKVVFHGKLRWIANLREYSAIERVLWRKGKLDHMVEVFKIESCFLELSNGPREKHKKYVDAFAPACLATYGVSPRFQDYDIAREYLLTLADYKYTFGDFLDGTLEFAGPDIEEILRIRHVEVMSNHMVVDLLAHADAVLGADYELNAPGRTDMAGEASFSEINETPELKRFITETSNVKYGGVAPISALSSTGQVDSTVVAHEHSRKYKMDDNEHGNIDHPRCVRFLENFISDEVNTMFEPHERWSIPQMDNSVVTDFESSVDIQSKATTTFIESAHIKEGVAVNKGYTSDGFISSHDDIKSFLARPLLLSTGQWTNVEVENTNLLSLDITPTLTNTMWADKIKGFGLFRGDFMVKVEINASPFQQGKLILHYLPNAYYFTQTNTNYLKMKNKSMINKVQQPHMEVDCRDTGVAMRIPYISPTTWYDIKNASISQGVLFLDVFSPLLTGTAAPAGQTYVDFAVYCWWENVDLHAPTAPQFDTTVICEPQASKKVVRGGGETAENTGPISQGLRKVGAVANVLSSVPVLSDYMRPVEWVSNILSGVTSVLGWSKPRELEGQTNVYSQLTRYAGTCDGPDTAFPGGISCLNRLETIDYASFTNEDEMSLEYLYKVPYYAGSFVWNATDGQGTSLYSSKVSPVDILTTDTDVVSTHTVSYQYHVPFTFLAKFHNYWRGNMKVTLKFIKTQMHSGRLQVTWLPGNILGTTPSLTTSAYGKRAIVDLRTEDTITFELPYLMNCDYLPTTQIGTAGVFTQHTYMGQFDIQVLNDLRAPESCSQSVNVQVFYSAGEDYELAVPKNSNSGSCCYEPQSDSTVLVTESITQGMELPITEIGGKSLSTDSLAHAKRCIGDKVLSIKSYLLRNSVLLGPVGGTFAWNTANAYNIDPYHISVSSATIAGVLTAPKFCADAFSLFSPWYAYTRGGVRMTVYQPSSTATIVSNIVPAIGSYTTDPTSAVFTNNNVFANTAELTGATHTNPLEPCNYIDGSTSIAYQHIPYYNRFPFHCNTYYGGTANLGIDKDFTKPIVNWQVKCPTANFATTTVVQRSVTDDFQLMFFTGCPPLVTNYV